MVRAEEGNVPKGEDEGGREGEAPRKILPLRKYNNQNYQSFNILYTPIKSPSPQKYLAI